VIVQGSGFSAAAGQKNGQSNRIRNYIFVINGVVSYERWVDENSPVSLMPIDLSRASLAGRSGAEIPLAGL